MNNLTRSQDEPLDELTLEMRDDLEDLYRVPVPAMGFDPTAVEARARPSIVRRGWRPALVGAAAAAGIAAFLAGTSLWGGGAQEVSAEQIFERTKAVSTTNPLTVNVDWDSYHLTSRSEQTFTEVPGVKSSSTVTEVWYDGADRQRSETRDAETGELLSGFLKLDDDMWFYSEEDGELQAVHNSLRDGEFSIGVGVAAQIGFGAGSITEVLNSFTNECTDAQLAGEDTVAGRSAYVIEVIPTPETCDIRVIDDPDFGDLVVEDASEGATIVTSVDGSDDGGKVSVFGGDRPMRMWIDQETFMTLKTESGFGDGEISYEVTSLDLDADFSGQTGLFELPEDARIVEAGSPEAGGIGFQVFTTDAGTSVELKGEGLPEISVDLRQEP